MKNLVLGLGLIVSTSGCLRLLEPADLQGTWVATSFLLTEADNPTNQVDLLVESNVAALAFAFDQNRYQSRVVDLMGMEELYDDEYILDGSFIIFKNFRGEDARMGIEIDNDTTMRLNDPITEFDITGDGEPNLVIMDVYLARQ